MYEVPPTFISNLVLHRVLIQFGEYALMMDVPRMATVRTAEKSLFLAISRDNFTAFLRIAPALGRAIELEAKERLLAVYRTLEVRLQRQPVSSRRSEFCNDGAGAAQLMV